MSGIIVTNNAVYNDIKDGIHLGQAGTISSANNNTITGNILTVNHRYGILLEDGSTGNTINNNSVRDNTAGDILDQVGGNTITNN